jgi:hypothetical protein
MSRAPIDVEPHLADAIKALHIRLDEVDHPVPRKKLPAVGMPRKLEIKAELVSFIGMMRLMAKEDFQSRFFGPGEGF